MSCIIQSLFCMSCFSTDYISQYTVEQPWAHYCLREEHKVSHVCQTWVALDETATMKPAIKAEVQKFSMSGNLPLPWRIVRWSTSWRSFSVPHHVHLKREGKRRKKKLERILWHVTKSYFTIWEVLFHYNDIYHIIIIFYFIIKNNK